MIWPIECAPGAQAAIVMPMIEMKTPVSRKGRAVRRTAEPSQCGESAPLILR